MEDPGEKPFPRAGRSEQQDVLVRGPDAGRESAHIFREVIPLIFPARRTFFHGSLRSPRLDGIATESGSGPLDIAASTHTDRSRPRIVQRRVWDEAAQQVPHGFRAVRRRPFEFILLLPILPEPGVGQRRSGRHGNVNCTSHYVMSS